MCSDDSKLYNTTFLICPNISRTFLLISDRASFKKECHRCFYTPTARYQCILQYLQCVNYHDNEQVKSISVSTQLCLLDSSSSCAAMCFNLKYVIFRVTKHIEEDNILWPWCWPNLGRHVAAQLDRWLWLFKENLSSFFPWDLPVVKISPEWVMGPEQG